jgi:hypothetical protein
MSPRQLCRLVAVTSALAACVASAAVARADEPPARLPAFGGQGQVVIDDLVGAGMRPSPAGLTTSYGLIGYTSSSSTVTLPSDTPDRDTFTTFSFTPTADVFIVNRVSFGLELAVAWQEEKDVNQISGRESTWSVTAAPRIGYVVPIGAAFSFWPRIALGAGFSKTQGTGEYGPGKAATELAALELPLVLQLPRMFFLSLELDGVVEHTHGSGNQSSAENTGSDTAATLGGFVGAGVVL